MAMSVSHMGLCVSDLDRSLRFYCDGLGFEPLIKYDIGNEFAHTLEVEGDVQLISQMISRDGLMVELLHYASPGVTGAPSGSRNILGFTHLSFNVDDVDATIARLVEHGGTLVESTRTKNEYGDLVFVADPDGTRIELMNLAQ
jgi:catechol 2,3-dioxygenase-like lactoylglutathione lyase family enzyme